MYSGLEYNFLFRSVFLRRSSSFLASSIDTFKPNYGHVVNSTPVPKIKGGPVMGRPLQTDRQVLGWGRVQRHNNERCRALYDQRGTLFRANHDLIAREEVTVFGAYFNYRFILVAEFGAHHLAVSDHRCAGGDTRCIHNLQAPQAVAERGVRIAQEIAAVAILRQPQSVVVICIENDPLGRNFVCCVDLLHCTGDEINERPALRNTEQAGR